MGIDGDLGASSRLRDNDDVGLGGNEDGRDMGADVALGGNEDGEAIGIEGDLGGMGLGGGGTIGENVEKLTRGNAMDGLLSGAKTVAEGGGSANTRTQNIPRQRNDAKSSRESGLRNAALRDTQIQENQGN
ncbi:hypothetical protein CJ030_MR6G003653 [Morella rubra]|uniref:Uncharacterized protein n=1 Tax=Morella rubra TaxID=262757 RepID=A0A6A1V789_9ROSI|nr:hypothetical protein CJ030_MR6G003653 [Morella rubra]